MNHVDLMGRLVRDPDCRYTQGDKPMCISRYTLAVDRRRTKDGDQKADFISCVAFGKAGEFVEKYLHKGTKICVGGRIQTGSYTKKDGTKVYTTDVVVEEQEFAESKSSQGSAPAAPEQGGQSSTPQTDENGFMDIPDEIQEELPFA